MICHGDHGPLVFLSDNSLSSGLYHKLVVCSERKKKNGIGWVWLKRVLSSTHSLTSAVVPIRSPPKISMEDLSFVQECFLLDEALEGYYEAKYQEEIF